MYGTSKIGQSEAGEIVESSLSLDKSMSMGFDSKGGFWFTQWAQLSGFLAL